MTRDKGHQCRIDPIRILGNYKVRCPTCKVVGQSPDRAEARKIAQLHARKQR